MTTYPDIFRDGFYRYMLGQPYEAYVEQSVKKITDRIGDAKEVLSVGCGDGEIEARLSDKCVITCYDIHPTAQVTHPELHWVSELPNGQYDAVYAHGSVFACIPHDEKQSFIDALASRVKDGGTLYVCAGYSKLNRVCRAKVYSVDGKTVTLARTSRGEGTQEITTHIWGLTKIVSTYFLGNVEDYWGDNKDRINCTT